MRMIKPALITAVVAAMFLGCPHPHGSPGMTPASSQRMFKLPYDRVWNATLAVMSEDLNLPLDEIVPENGLITTEWIRYVKKPGGVNDPKRPGGKNKPDIIVEYRVVVLVKISPEGTLVRARRYMREFRDRWYPITTDLMFERQFLNLVAARLGTP